MHSLLSTLIACVSGSRGRSMASEEFKMEIKTQDSPSENNSRWVVELEEKLAKRVVKTSAPSSPAVFCVSKVFLASYHQFYVPSLISIGPYHFGKTEFNSMEPHKTEAVGRMKDRIHGRTMQSIVKEEIVAMDKTIRAFYDKELSYSTIDLAWMVTKDSCFLFEFMLNYLRTRKGNEDFLKDSVVKGNYDAILSASLISPMWKNILYDLILVENQIPLSVLQSLLSINSKGDAEKIVRGILNKAAKLNGNMVFGWGMSEPYMREKTRHFLEVLYYQHVGPDLKSYGEEAYPRKDGPLLHLGWIKSTFTNCCSRLMKGGGAEDQVPAFRVKLPSAGELNKKGINLCVITSTNSDIQNHPEGIRWVRFEEETSTLYLPEVRIDPLRHALLRNFIELEYNSLYSPYPITSFAFFMNELVDSEDDVALLREANILKNFFGSNKEAAECFNALTVGYHMSQGCKPLNDARVGLHKYLRREYRILWNEFISTYFAKPWLVAGSVAAALLLLMTMLQVYCLFYTCNPKP